MEARRRLHVEDSSVIGGPSPPVQELNLSFNNSETPLLIAYIYVLMYTNIYIYVCIFI